MISHIVKNVLVIVFALLMIVFSWFILSRTEYINFFSKGKNNEVKNPDIITLEQECVSYQYLENGICKDITHTCQNGEIVNDSALCSESNASSTVGSLEMATTSDIVQVETSSSKSNTATTSSKAVVVNKNPKIQNVKITSSGKNITVSISGTNFDKSANILTFIAGADINKRMTLPAYPAPNNTQVINFQMTDFRTTYTGTYSFQVEAKGKTSNVFNVAE